MRTKEEWDRTFSKLADVGTFALGALSVALGIMALSGPRLGQRIYYEDGQYLVAVRYPGQWNELRDFVQPDNPDVIAIYSQYGPDPWGLYDFVCRNISYRRDIGEFWQTPSETLQGYGDCEDSSLLLCSLLRNFSDAHVALGSFQGWGHAWVVNKEGEILEATYTNARRVPDPGSYEPYCLFNESEVIELWPGALGEVFELGRNEVTKLSLMAEAIGDEVPPECPSCWPLMVVGLVTGGILGTGFATILQKGE
ncbi:hypothetical protein ES706_04875 [subsurface metagenome]